MKIILQAVGMVLFLVPTLLAQSGIATPVERMGRIFSATIRPEALGTRAFVTDEEKPWFQVVALGIRDSDSATNGNLSLGYGTKVGAHDVFFNGTYTRVRPDDGDGANRFSGYGEVALFSGWANVSGVGLATYDPDAFTYYGGVLVVEREIIPRRFSVVGNLGWVQVDPDGGDSVDDIQPAFGIAASSRDGLWNAGFDYTLDNDVDGEDTGSFALSRKFTKISSKLKLTAEKHGVCGISFSKVF